jgi:uncharacterized protein with von Willebrand factor type A (vWA) domain
MPEPAGSTVTAGSAVTNGGSATDLALLCAHFGDLLRSAGVAVPVERVTWWATATVAAEPALIHELYWLARVTLVDRAEHLETFDAVFGQVFRGLVDVADFRGDPNNSPLPNTEPGEPQGSDDKNTEPRPDADGVVEQPRTAPAGADSDDEHSDPDDDEGAPTLLAMASEIELLRDRDFADCDAEELALLAGIIDRMKVVAPVRPSRWEPSRNSGRSIDLRRTLRAAARTGGDPIHWSHRRRGTIARPIVMLADVSGSMQAYSRVYLRVLQGAVIGARAHAYVFATQLHPVTRALGRGRREDAIARALMMSPDASGGTRIGGAVKNFLDTDGRRGLARGAVVVVVSDGWERADPALLGEQMARLSRLAHRVIWVNPRKAAPGFAPLTGGMAAALPHVDAFVSGHSARSVQELLDAIAAA